jgi:hypothetical protein
MGGVDAIGDNRDILTMKTVAEQRGCSLRDSRQSDFRISVDAPFQVGKKSVIGAPMKTTKKTQAGGLRLFVAGKFQEAMEKSVNDDQIRVETIYPRRENEIKAQSMSPSIPSATNGVQKKPAEKLQEMRTRDARNSMPNDPARICRPHGRGAVECKVLDTLGVKMDFAMLVARETLEKFGERALRAMAPVNKG